MKDTSILSVFIYLHPLILGVVYDSGLISASEGEMNRINQLFSTMIYRWL